MIFNESHRACTGGIDFNALRYRTNTEPKAKSGCLLAIEVRGLDLLLEAGSRNLHPIGTWLLKRDCKTAVALGSCAGLCSGCGVTDDDLGVWDDGAGLIGDETVDSDAGERCQVAGLVGLRGELGFGGKRDLGAAGVVGGGEGLEEGLRGTGDEVEVDVDPVRAGGVVDDGPALEGGGLVGFAIGEKDAVGGLPDGDLGDVGDAEVAAAAGSVGGAIEEGEVAEALVAGASEEFQVAGDVGVEGGVEQDDGGGGGEFEGADGAGVGDYGEEATVA